jgi:hypothetical protein
MNIYTLPFDTTIEVSNSHRFVLVREFTPDLDSYVVLYTDDVSRVEQEYKRATDYVIDQMTGLVTYCINGITEVFQSRYNRKVGQVDDLDPGRSRVSGRTGSAETALSGDDFYPMAAPEKDGPGPAIPAITSTTILQ